ncbi:MAG: nicotinate-nucleotide adenylyltransferase [Ardenticatenaceae bacterium]
MDNYTTNKERPLKLLSCSQVPVTASFALKWGICGGTFDPPHMGHLVMAEAARAQLGLDEVLFMPAAQPPHKQGKKISATEHRVAMVREAIADHEHFRLSTFEVTREGANYTVETMRLLREKWGDKVELFFIMGGDSLLDLPIWYKPQDLIQLVNLAVIARPGYHADIDVLERTLPGIRQRLYFARAPLIGISSTDIRQRVQKGDTIRYLVPRGVERYIYEQGLYGPSARHFGSEGLLPDEPGARHFGSDGHLPDGPSARHFGSDGHFPDGPPKIE